MVSVFNECLFAYDWEKIFIYRLSLAVLSFIVLYFIFLIAIFFMVFESSNDFTQNLFIQIRRNKILF